MTEISGPLAGTRALDLIDGLGAYGPKLLTGLGAEVIRVERPGGSAQRRSYPLYEVLERPGEEALSLYFLHYNAGKKGITLDPASPKGRDLLRRLLDQVDVVFDNGILAGLGFGLDELASKSPPLVVVSVTAFGLTGPRRSWLGDDLICQAMSGMISYYGYRGERPARFGPHQASEMSGLAAALGALIALYDARRSGKGDVIDVAAERVGALVTFQMSNASLYHQFGFKRARHLRGAEANTLYEASDGFVQLGAFRSLAPLQKVLERAGEGEGLAEIAADLPDGEFGRHPRVQEIIRRFVGARTRWQVAEAVQAEDVMCVPVNDAADLVADPFLRGRAFFAEVEQPELGLSWLDAGVPIRFERTPFLIGRRPPLLGEHNAEVFGRIGLQRDEILALTKEGVL